MTEASVAGETTAYIQGSEPIICLNMSLRIAVVITNTAVITGINVGLKKHHLAMIRATCPAMATMNI